MMTSIRPLHDRVLVRRANEETVTPGGLVIPGSAAEKPARGTVVATGKGKLKDCGEYRPLDVQVGDEVLFGKYSGTEVAVDGEKLLMMREEDILGIVTEGQSCCGGGCR